MYVIVFILTLLKMVYWAFGATQCKPKAIPINMQDVKSLKSFIQASMWVWEENSSVFVWWNQTDNLDSTFHSAKWLRS